MVADAAAPVILTNAALAPVFADSGARLLFDTEPAAETGAAEPGSRASRRSRLRALYIRFDRPSQGGRHRASQPDQSYLLGPLDFVRCTRLRGVLFSTSLNFDLSAFEMFLPLAFGGCIVLVENLLTLQSAPQREKVRLVNTGPSLLDALLRAGGLPVRGHDRYSRRRKAVTPHGGRRVRSAARSAIAQLLRSD